jgi:hypothetical protein
MGTFGAPMTVVKGQEAAAVLARLSGSATLPDYVPGRNDMPWTPKQKAMLGARCAGKQTKGFKDMSREEACAATKEGTRKPVKKGK